MPMGDIKWLFSKSMQVFDDNLDVHHLVHRKVLAEFFGETPRVIRGWEQRGFLSRYYKVSPQDRRSNFYDLNALFTEDRQLTFVPPTAHRLVSSFMDGEDRDLLKFLKRINRR